MNPVEIAVSVGLLLLALAWMVGIQLLRRWVARALAEAPVRAEKNLADAFAAVEQQIGDIYNQIGPPPGWAEDWNSAEDSVYDDEPTEIIVREPAIYTDRDPTVQVNVRKPQPWEWAK